MRCRGDIHLEFDCCYCDYIHRAVQWLSDVGDWWPFSIDWLSHIYSVVPLKHSDRKYLPLWASLTETHCHCSDSVLMFSCPIDQWWYLFGQWSLSDLNYRDWLKCPFSCWPLFICSVWWSILTIDDWYSIVCLYSRDLNHLYHWKLHLWYQYLIFWWSDDIWWLYCVCVLLINTISRVFNWWSWRLIQKLISSLDLWPFPLPLSLWWYTDGGDTIILRHLLSIPDTFVYSHFLFCYHW